MTRLAGVAGIALLALTACDRRSAGSTSDQGGGGDTIELRRERTADITGDGRPERFLVVASGPRYDSLDIALEIRSAGDSVLFATDWRSSDYFRASGPRAADSTIQRTVIEQLDRLLADESFGTGVKDILEDDALLEDEMRDAITLDVAEEMWRQQHRIPADSATPSGAFDEIQELARTRVSKDRIDALTAELSTRPSFRYFTGGEATDAIAWSDEERRFVTVFSCC